MNLIQLRYIREIVRQNLSISNASAALHTSQSGVSRQVQLLEEELKLLIFQRNGKRLVGITEPGKLIVSLAERVLRDLDNIKKVGEEFTRKDKGTLTIATTHTQATLFPAACRQAIQAGLSGCCLIHPSRQSHPSGRTSGKWRGGYWFRHGSHQLLRQSLVLALLPMESLHSHTGRPSFVG